MSYAKYESYKDSGVDWLGEIPSDWELLKVKNIFRLVMKFAPKNNDCELLSVYTDIGVKPRKELEERGNRATTTDGYLIVEKGDIVVNKLLAWMGAIGLSDYDGVTSPAYDILKPKIPIEGIFYHLLFRSPQCTSELRRYSRGIMDMRLRLYFDKFGDVVVPYPNIEVQKKIVSFLAKKTTQIDQAIALKQQQIEKLNEYKQIVIQNAVTKGLNPNAPMKDSGVAWIGDIPEHWDVKKLKNVSKVVLGKMICNEKTGNMKLKPYLKSKNIQWLKVDLNSVDEMWFTPKEMEMYRLKQGDLVLSEGGEVGKTCIWNNDLEECYIQNSAHKVTFENKQNSKYYLYLFFSLGKQGQFEKIVNRVSIGHLTKEKLINTFVFCPPLSEQNEIVKLIDDYLIKFNEIINCYETQIDRLKEYKNILINQAVTGKIKI